MIDYAFDPCRHLATLNLDDRSHQVSILKRDKHTRIEGLYTEKLFAKDLLATSFNDYSTGWWFASSSGSFKVFKLAGSIENISPLDFELLNFFSGNGVFTSVVSFEKAANGFSFLRFAHNSLPGFLTDWPTGKKSIPLCSQPPGLPFQNQRNDGRLDKAIRLFDDVAELKQAAIERLFANCFMGGGYFWDMDGFVMDGSRVTGFEVKQKFPHKGGAFGLNNGLIRLFTFLKSLRARVVHVIITKPVWDDSIPATDFYTDERLKARTQWIACDFDERKFTGQGEAPSKTSIYNTSTLKYKNITLNHFHHLKYLGEEMPGILAKFLNGETRPLPGIEGLARVDDY